MPDTDTGRGTLDAEVMGPPAPVTFKLICSPDDAMYFERIKVTDSRNGTTSAAAGPRLRNTVDTSIVDAALFASDTS